MQDITRRDAIRGMCLMLGSAVFFDGCARDAETVTGMKDLTEGIDAVERKHVRNPILFSGRKPVVSVTKIPERMSKKRGIEHAVREAVDLLGRIEDITKDKERILLKPNLVNHMVSDTTKPEVIEALIGLMREAGKDVYVGEGSAGAKPNIKYLLKGYVCRTKDIETLEKLQANAFEELGYADLSQRTKVPLVNLHVGEMVKYRVPDNSVFRSIYVHSALHDADMVCSVPMMKTHSLAGVTLGMKNFIGAYPGQVYGTVRTRVHQVAQHVEPSGTASAIVDMVKGIKLGLTVIDGSTAMEGQGPTKTVGGKLVEMNTIVAGTNALATDMVAAYIMGFDPNDISTFKWAWKAGMKPVAMESIEVRGESLRDVARDFKKPVIIPYREIASWYGPEC